MRTWGRAVEHVHNAVTTAGTKMELTGHAAFVDVQQRWRISVGQTEQHTLLQ